MIEKQIDHDTKTVTHTQEQVATATAASIRPHKLVLYRQLHIITSTIIATTGCRRRVKRIRGGRGYQ